MSDSDQQAWEEARKIRRERLAPIFARLGDRPPGMISVGPGWFDLVLELDQRIAALDPDYTVAQVKEKFGGLCYYIERSEGYGPVENWSTDPIEVATREFEARSVMTCEDCGAPGEPRRGGWVITLCDACLADRGDDRKIK